LSRHERDDTAVDSGINQFQWIDDKVSRPASDEAFEKTTYYTKVGDQVCGVGYYME